MYKGFGAKVVTIIFDQSRPRESHHMMGIVRREYDSLGLPAILYLGKDAPEGIEDIGFLVKGEFYSADRTSEVVDKLNELEKAASTI
jgi:hypothetical protein